MAVCDEDCDTRYPLNINDDDITVGMLVPPEPLPLSTHQSDLSFMLSRFKVTDILGKVFRTVYGVKRPSYSVALKLDLEVRQAMNDIPEYFRGALANSDWTPQRELQACVVNGLLLRTSIILHQSFLREAVCRYTQNDLYTQSRVTGLATCRKLLKCQLQRYHNKVLFEKYEWYLNGPILFQVIHGACLLALVLCADPTYREAKDDWALLQESVKTYHRMALVSKVAERAVALLTPICDRIRTRISQTQESSTLSTATESASTNNITELADGVISWDEWDKLFSDFDFTPNVDTKMLNAIEIDLGS